MREAINGLMAQVIEGYIHTHIANPAVKTHAARQKRAAKLIDVIHIYLK